MMALVRREGKLEASVGQSTGGRHWNPRRACRCKEFPNQLTSGDVISHFLQQRDEVLYRVRRRGMHESVGFAGNLDEALTDASRIRAVTTFLKRVCLCPEVRCASLALAIGREHSPERGRIRVIGPPQMRSSPTDPPAAAHVSLTDF